MSIDDVPGCDQQAFVIALNEINGFKRTSIGMNVFIIPFQLFRQGTNT